jgi:hypothetical protein
LDSLKLSKQELFAHTRTRESFLIARSELTVQSKFEEQRVASHRPDGLPLVKTGSLLVKIDNNSSKSEKVTAILVFLRIASSTNTRFKVEPNDPRSHKRVLPILACGENFWLLKYIEI